MDEWLGDIEPTRKLGLRPADEMKQSAELGLRATFRHQRDVNTSLRVGQRESRYSVPPLEAHDAIEEQVPGDPFYARPAWRQFRAALLEARPACQVPGCRRAAHHVDHIVSMRAGGPAFDASNVQALCHSHHSSKTARLDVPSRRHRPAQAVANGCDIDGWPLSEPSNIKVLGEGGDIKC